MMSVKLRVKKATLEVERDAGKARVRRRAAPNTRTRAEVEKDAAAVLSLRAEDVRRSVRNAKARARRARTSGAVIFAEVRVVLRPSGGRNFRTVWCRSTPKVGLFGTRGMEIHVGGRDLTSREKKLVLKAAREARRAVERTRLGRTRTVR